MLGSVGQGDLAPMADLAAELFGDFELLAKEGIALINSNAFSTALASLAVSDAERLVSTLDVTGAMDLEAFAANLTMLHPAIGDVRPYPGLCFALERIRGLLEGSYLWEPGAARNLQDPLTFRCLPQIHGATRDALEFAKRQLEIGAQRLAGEPARHPGRGSHRLGRELRHPAARRRAGLPPRGARTRVDERMRAAAQAAAGAAHRPPGRARAEAGSRRELARRARRRRAGVHRRGPPPRAARLLRGRHLDARRRDRRPDHHGAAGSPPPLRDGRARRAPRRDRLHGRRPGDRPARSRLRWEPGTKRAFDLVRERVPFMGEGDPLPADLDPVRDLIVAGAFVA